MQKTEEQISYLWHSKIILKKILLFISLSLTALLSVGLVITMGGCITTPPPIEEYTIAWTAIESARSVEAARYAAGYWYQSVEAYRLGKQFFENRDYSAAKKEFDKARMTAEKAENSARYMRLKNGDVF